MAFLPQKFAGAEEGGWELEFPSDNITPLVELQRKVSMRLDPIREGWVHDCFRSWTDGDWLGEISVTTLGDPGDFRSKSLNVVLFLFQSFFGYKKWEVAILNAQFQNLQGTC